MNPRTGQTFIEHKWTFKVDELSCGHYSVTARRDTGNTVFREGSEAVLWSTVSDMFEIECNLGAHPSIALFISCKQAYPQWIWTYDNKRFGSWQGESKSKAMRIIYDGRDSWLTVSKDRKLLVSEKLSNIATAPIDVFRVLFSA